MSYHFYSDLLRKVSQYDSSFDQNGADVNAKFIIESHRGAILKSTTALHNAASVKDKVPFEALIEAGADITIPDALGNTIESVEFNFRRN